VSPRPRAQVSARTIWIIGLNVIALMALCLFLYYARSALTLIIVAGFLTLALYSPVSLLEKLRLPRWVAVLAIFTAAFVLIGVLLVTFLPLLATQGRALIESAPALIERLRSHEPVAWADRQFRLTERLTEMQTVRPGDAAGPLFGLLAGIFRGMFDMVTVVVLTIFMLIFGDEVRDRLIEMVPANRKRFVATGREIRRTVGAYVLGTLLVSAIGGVIVTVALIVLRVPYFLPLGVAMTLLGVIPYVGPTLAAILIVSVTAATSGLAKGFIMLIVFLCYQLLENNLLQPLVQQRTIKMNPLLIVVAMLLGTTLAGLLGALLALPAAGTMQVILRDVRAYRQADLLGEEEE